MTPMSYRFSDKADTAIVTFMVNLAATLNLKNWTLGLSPRPPASDDECDGDAAFASVEPVPHRHFAVVRVCDDFLELGHRDILLTLVHELCHLYMVGLKQIVADQGTIHSMGVAERSQLQVRQHHEEEMAVDLMANAWADVLWEWESVHKALRRITPRVERSAP